MHASTMFAPLAAFASMAAAFPALVPAVVDLSVNDFNFTAYPWGYWTVSNVSATISPSNTHLKFVMQYSSQSTLNTCESSIEGRQTGPNATYYPCQDEVASYQVSTALDKLYLSQKLYQTGAIANLQGNATLKLNCEPTMAGEACTADNFIVPVSNEYATLPGRQ